MLNKILIGLLIIAHTILCIMFGFIAGVEDTHRKAYENGHMTIYRVGDNRVYRWIELHKLGYDYDE